MTTRQALRRTRGTLIFTATILLIEFLDEFIYGAVETAWPLIQRDLALTYLQIGLLMSLPNFFASFIEPVIGLLADAGHRRALLLGGGVMVAVGLVLVAGSTHFLMLMVALALMAPASGAFVTLAQTVLMDHAPERQEQNMARWTFAGSVGVVAGPLALSVALALSGGWRGLMLAFAALTVAVLLAATRISIPRNGSGDESDIPPTFWQAARTAWIAVRRRTVLRWLVLLELSDLMLDVLLGFLALYLVNVQGVSVEQAALAVMVWTGVGLVGDFLLIPLLERVQGIVYLRYSAVLEVLLYPAFLLVDSFAAQVVILGLLGFFNAGWYAILQARLYAVLPGRSGTVMAVTAAAGLVATLIPLGLGVIADQVSLTVAMWLLLAGPVALLIGLPKESGESGTAT